MASNVTAPIRCLIVDDEELAREAVRSYIALDSMLEVVGEAGDGHGAVRSIETLRPDLLFLDVQMPEVDGFEVLQELVAKNITLPLTIFVTAYDTYALRAFEAHALDYLLKPIREERFKDAVLVAKSRIASDRSRQTIDELASLLAGSNFPGGHPKRLPVKVEGRIAFVKLDQVEWIDSEGNHVRLHGSSGTHTIRETLSALEAKLDPAQFMRVHRSHIVNIHYIKDLRPWFTGEYIIRMQSGKELTLTRTYRRNLQRLIGKEKF